MGGGSTEQTGCVYWQRGCERASGRDAQEIGRQARDAPQLVAALVDARNGLQQRARVGMGGRPVERVDAGLFDDAPGVHDGNAIRDRGDDPEVVSNQDDRELNGPAQFREKVHDLRLHGDIERGGGLVGDEDARVLGERHGDHHALAHAAGELVGIS